MNLLLMIITSTLIVSLISVIGVLTLLLKEKLLDKILLVLIALSAGSLFSGAFLHLIPESMERISADLVFIYVIIGFFSFFIIEKFLYWRHCHTAKCEIHPFAYLNLVGDSIHNLIDGLVIAAGFIASPKLGIITTFAVILHEIPQEFSDFGVLVYGGFEKYKALLLNLLTALFALIGGILGYLLGAYALEISYLLLPFAAGGFIYISASDLMPELKKDSSLKNSIINLAFFAIGILLVYIIKFIGPA